jgi:hypothetical protein
MAPEDETSGDQGQIDLDVNGIRDPVIRLYAIATFCAQGARSTA